VTLHRTALSESHRRADLRFLTRRFWLGRSRKLSKNCSRSSISDVPMLKIQPKYIIVSRIENSPYNAVSCNSNEMCCHIVHKSALVMLTAARETANRAKCDTFVISFNVTPCGLVQCYVSEDHNLHIHLCKNLKLNVLKHQKGSRKLHI
jgi:hypothetical protein